MRYFEAAVLSVAVFINNTKRPEETFNVLPSFVQTFGFHSLHTFKLDYLNMFFFSFEH
jgi:hypothetical protein